MDVSAQPRWVKVEGIALSKDRPQREKRDCAWCVSLTKGIPLHDVLQTESGKEHERIAVVDLSELLVVDESILVHVELLQSLLEIARKRRRRVVDTSAGEKRRAF